MQFFRIIRGVKNKFFQSFYSLLNWMTLHIESVNTNSELSIYGRIFIRNYGTISFGKNVKITSAFIKNPIGPAVFSSFVTTRSGNIKVGNGTGISNSFFYSKSSISIGNNVLIGSGCQVFDTDFHSIHSKIRMSDNDVGKVAPVIISDNVFIGAETIILKGSVIGANSVIGAKSLVSGNIPANEIWAGNPAKFIKNIPQI
jgi:acetyltransferase-like isoleucine patch superfamily enzyme